MNNVILKNGYTIDGRFFIKHEERPRIKEKILKKALRPSLEFDEEDVFGVVEYLCRDLDEEEAKEELLEFATELCLRYDRDVKGDARETTSHLLLELDQQVGLRKERDESAAFFKAQNRQREKQARVDQLKRDFKAWKGGDDGKTAYQFYNLKGEFNKYALCRTDFFKALRPLDGEVYKPEKVIEDPKDALSFLREYPLFILKQFTRYLSFAALNVCLEETLRKYLEVMCWEKETHHSPSDRKHFILFLDGLSESEFNEIIAAEKKRDGISGII